MWMSFDTTTLPCLMSCLPSRVRPSRAPCCGSFLTSMSGPVAIWTSSAPSGIWSRWATPPVSWLANPSCTTMRRRPARPFGSTSFRFRRRCCWVLKICRRANYPLLRDGTLPTPYAPLRARSTSSTLYRTTSRIFTPSGRSRSWHRILTALDFSGSRRAAGWPASWRMNMAWPPTL